MENQNSGTAGTAKHQAKSLTRSIIPIEILEKNQMITFYSPKS